MSHFIKKWKSAVLIIVLSIYTAYAAGPLFWVSMMSLRTTSEIAHNPYGFPNKLHLGKFADAWVASSYNVYFSNSVKVVISAVAIVTLIGGMAAHCFARYRFPLRKLFYFTIFSTIIFPPQITIIALFQILVEYGLYNTLTGLTLTYVAFQLPITVYVLESFFARIPSDLYDAARMDGYSEWRIFWKVSMPVALPALSTTIILNTSLLWNEFLYAVVLITDETKRTLPLGIQKFMGDQMEDIGMIATGLMIAIVPVVIIYVFFSEKLIQGMTAGAVK
jgi:multiple sugar transport system permease protein/raffinose/stachyose/melibiose transport system permease protein